MDVLCMYYCVCTVLGVGVLLWSVYVLKSSTASNSDKASLEQISCEGVPLYHITPLLDKSLVQKWQGTKLVQKVLEQTIPKIARKKFVQKVLEQTSPKIIMTSPL